MGLCDFPTQPPQTALRLWFQRRRDKQGTRSGQAVPLAPSMNQEEIVAIPIRKDATRKVEEGHLRVMHNNNRICLTIKGEDNKPFGKRVDVIGE